MQATDCKVDVILYHPKARNVSLACPHAHEYLAKFDLAGSSLNAGVVAIVKVKYVSFLGESEPDHLSFVVCNRKFGVMEVLTGRVSTTTRRQ